MALEKRYDYKISRGGTYLGMLDNVDSEFNYGLDINTGAAQLIIEVDKNAFVADMPPENLETEDGQLLQAEDGSVLTTEGAQDVVGSADSRTLIQNDNEVEVYEISADNPNGVLVFSGYITKWRAKFGKPGITITVLSKGIDLADYVIESGETLKASAVNEDTSLDGAFWGAAWAQQIFPTGSNINLSKIALKAKIDASTDPVIVTPVLCQGNPDNDMLTVIGGVGTYSMGAGNSILATFSPATVSETSYTEKEFSLSEDVTLTNGGSYYIRYHTTPGLNSTLKFRASNTLGTLPIEKAYYVAATANNSSYDLAYSTSKDTMYIKLYESTGNTTSLYSTTEVADIVRDVIDNYNSQGGVVTYDSNSIDDTGVTVTYQFVLATALEGVQKGLDLAPYNFYWYVDPATQLLYFKETPTTADHLFVLGRHIEDLELEASVENNKNVVYFSGGDTGGGENLFSKYSNADNIEALGRQRLERRSDNRVTVAATADAIGNSVLDQGDGEDYQSPLTISDEYYDISTINPGDVVGFGGFGNFIDQLLLQIARVERYPHYVVLTLGILPERASGTLKDIETDLAYLQTIDNPDAPS